MITASGFSQRPPSHPVQNVPVKCLDHDPLDRLPEPGRAEEAAVAGRQDDAGLVPGHRLKDEAAVD